ncbi:hypothetical protein [Actinocrispum wychmicini]|uniref:Cell division protein FtsL n=1 Tax=Actinocrispum wychmicini TaxID=1213861 RepID=A0A4R2JDS5_9PSEU|nr:hypothetical protein [Actinocrispum wychmicini]TCO56677.1 hypothetical protein EV192_106151 [Actinocrispum wychmicini]
MTAPSRVGGSSSRGRSSQSRRKLAAAAAAAEAKAGQDTVQPGTEESTTEASPRAPRRPRTAAAERAYARRAQREGRALGEPVRSAPRQKGQKAERGTASRASFVMLVMGLLVVGVITTLWLSTQAIADSYRLDQAKKAAAELSERAETLERDVAGLGSASTLADEAAKLGMVPAGDPARLVVNPDGTVTVVGDPKPVAGPPAPPPPSDQPTPEQPAIPQGNG